MALARHAEAEPIPGYRLLEPLGKGGFGEVWKCEAPGGLYKAIKFVHGANHALEPGRAGVEQELRALERIRSIRHPFLLSMDRIEIVDGELVIVMELADQSLHDQFQQCRNSGLPGIPRRELLNDLQEAAEALDLINIRHGLQHLDIKPRNLLLVSLHVKVADFGLVSRLAEASSATRQQLAAISPVYASPEVFQGTFSPTSDQYSLAMAYHELLTGELPFVGKNFRQLAVAHLQAEPNLQGLAEADQPAVARALAKDPAARFPSCSAFIQALLTANFPRAAFSPSGRLCWESESPVRSLVAAQPGEETIALPLPTSADLGDDMVSPEQGHTLSEVTASPASLSAYQFQECLDRSELSETWMAQAPVVGPCVVKFLYGLSELDAATRNKAMQRLAALTHPALVPTVLLRNDPSRLVLVSSRRGPTLRERWQKAKCDGLAGIPRGELLGLLRDAAQTLDALAEQQGLLHLALNPDNLQMVQGRTLLSDYGVAALLWLPSGHPLTVCNTRYSAPELYGNAIARPCDSYSLAVIYQEMLTGKHPFSPAAGKGVSRMPAKPDLSPLPACDRAVLQQALDRTPARRFATCTALLNALETLPASASTTVVSLSGKSNRPPSEVESSLSPAARLLHDIVACASGGCLLQEHGTFRYLLQPGQSIRHSFVARIVPHTLALTLEPFVQQWHAQLFDEAEDLLAYRLLFSGDAPGSLKTRAHGLEVHLVLRSRPTLLPPAVEVRIQIKPFGCTALAADTLMRQAGPAVLEHLRGLLQAHPERRTEDRLPYDEPITVWPLDAKGIEQMPLRGQGKDLSRNGVGLYMRRAPHCEQLHLFLSQNGRTVPVPVPVRVVRVEARGDRVEVGTMFTFEGETQS